MLAGLGSAVQSLQLFSRCFVAAMIHRIIRSVCCRRILVPRRVQRHPASSSPVTDEHRVKASHLRLGLSRTSGASASQVWSEDESCWKEGHGESGGWSDRFFFPRSLLMAGFFAKVASSIGLTEKTEEATEEPIVTAIKQGIYLLDSGEHAKAEVVLHKALDLALASSNDQAVDYVYVILADNAMAARDLTKAEMLYKETLRRILSKDAKEDDESVIEISLQLATIYAERKDFENADEGFAFCIQKQKARVANIDLKKVLSEEETNSIALYGMILDWFAKYCQLRGDVKLALKYTEEALKYASKALGESDDQTLILLSDMAILAEKSGDLDRAIELLKQAVERGSAVQSDELATFFYNLGICYMKKRDGHNANYCCLRALKLADNYKNASMRSMARSCVVRSREILPEAKLSSE